MKEGGILKTTFSTRYGDYEYVVMLFGLTNAPIAFMAFMNRVYPQYLEKFIIVFIDDIFVYFDNKSDNEIHLRMALQILREPILCQVL